MMRRALVTGCNGFVGRALVERLRSGGYEVRGVDRGDTSPALSSGDYLAGDLTDARFVGDVIGAGKIDCIVHLAAQASVKRSFDDPVGTLSDGTLPALHILEHLRRTGTKARVLLVGSAEEYGISNELERMPIPEIHPVHPTSPYALAKSIQNQYGVMYRALFGVDTVMTRSFNHTGPGQREDFVLASFARQVAEIRRGKREAVMHVGDLDVRRDFLDVRDVCGAYLVLLEKGRSGETYNVCSGSSYRIRDLLEKMCDLAGVTVTIEVDPARLRPVELRELRGDPSKIREHTGWSAKIPIEETLQSMLDDWDNKLRAA